MKQDVTLEVFYPHSPDRVWQALTDRRALTAWMMENDFEPRLGHKFQFRNPVLPGFDIFIRCEVIEIEPPKRLAYRWQDPQTHNSTIVRWKLTPVTGGTELQLQHDRVINTMAIDSAVMPQRSGNLYEALPPVKEYESPMNTLRQGALNDSPRTLQFNEFSISSTTESSLILQEEWNYRLIRLSQELNSDNTSDLTTELLESES
jgi:uncharacterized protein YndB with AHSA1/START domain